MVNMRALCIGGDGISGEFCPPSRGVILSSGLTYLLLSSSVGRSCRPELETVKVCLDEKAKYNPFCQETYPIWTS